MVSSVIMVVISSIVIFSSNYRYIVSSFIIYRIRTKIYLAVYIASIILFAPALCILSIIRSVLSLDPVVETSQVRKTFSFIRATIVLGKL